MVKTNNKITAKEYKKLFDKINPCLDLLETYVNKSFPLKVKDKYTGRVFERLPNSYLTGKLNKRIERHQIAINSNKLPNSKVSINQLDKLLSIEEPKIPVSRYTHNSKYETYIKYLLEESGIEYTPEKSFEWSKRVTKRGHIGRLRYDFFIPNNILIEYDGAQHYRETNIFKTTLKEQKERDLLKDTLARQHGYVVYRITTRNWEELKKDLTRILYNENLPSSGLEKHP